MIRINTIKMPDGCRYMSEYRELMDYLPVKGWYVLNKTLCGCGGTTVFLESDKDVILVSPRTNMLASKHKQYLESTYLFREAKSQKLDVLKEDLRDYINNGNDSYFPYSRKPRKILVTIDSYKHVASILGYMGKLDRYTVVVDEFQCLMADASFKANSEMEFLETLARTTPNVCFMSATPIPVEYLDYVEYFQDIPYYQLEWDPAVTETPNIQLTQMKRDESARVICRRIIEGYRKTGYFKSKPLYNGEVIYSREICIYLNEVHEIVSIIKDNHLDPDEVTILCSESTKQKTEILRLGFKIGGQCTDKDRPRNKTFTFLTSASFEGMDLYSDNAYTVVFFNARKKWETHDISIDLPQIMARQRLEMNPFRRDAEVFYKTKANPKTKEEFVEEVDAMIKNSEDTIEWFHNQDADRKKWLVDRLRDIKDEERYKDDFLDVIDMGEHGYDLKINYLLYLAHMNLWVMQNYYYDNKIRLVSGVIDKLSNNYGTKPQKLLYFEQEFFKCTSWPGKMKKLAEFIDNNPELEDVIRYNPHFNDDECQLYYDTLGSKRIEELGYRRSAIVEEYRYVIMKPQIIEMARRLFIPGTFYSNPIIKRRLSEIYAELDVHKLPSAKDITDFLDAEPKNSVESDGSRIRGYLIS